MSTVRITVLVDNYVRRAGLLAEHGWACWIETPTCRILFDTGQGYALMHNARELNIPLETADALVVSHGHYDHTGALAEVAELAPKARVFAHPAAFEAKYARTPDGGSRDIGVPADRVGLPDRLARRLVATIAPVDVCGDIAVTGQIPRTTSFEDAGGSFYLDQACRRPDPLVDDQTLFIRTNAGTVVVLGCAHAGVINTLEYTAQLTDNAPQGLLIGGMHLGAASDERIKRTIAELRRREVDRVVPAHCTGVSASAALRGGLPGQCMICEVGASFTWEC